MKINLVECDQLATFIYWNSEKQAYDTITCSVIEFLHTYTDIACLDIYTFERNYDERSSKKE